ncbi:hypothetical protein AB4254_08825 [Vibrio breoganii]
MKTPLIGLLTLALLGCDTEDQSSTRLSQNEIRSFLLETNIETDSPIRYTSHPSVPNINKTSVRFDISQTIPIYFVSSDGDDPHPTIKDAFTDIERTIERPTFTSWNLVSHDLTEFRDDTNPNENKPNGTFPTSDFYDTHGIQYGIVVATNTAPQISPTHGTSLCNTMSIYPYHDTAQIKYDENTNYYTQDNILWINLGNSKCVVSKEDIKHYVAQALGLYKPLATYFNPWSYGAEQLLFNLYLNEAGMHPDDMLIAYNE